MVNKIPKYEKIDDILNKDFKLLDKLKSYISSFKMHTFFGDEITSEEFIKNFQTIFEIIDKVKEEMKKYITESDKIPKDVKKEIKNLIKKFEPLNKQKEKLKIPKMRILEVLDSNLYMSRVDIQKRLREKYNKSYQVNTISHICHILIQEGKVEKENFFKQHIGRPKVGFRKKKI